MAVSAAAMFLAKVDDEKLAQFVATFAREMTALAALSDDPLSTTR